MHATAHAFDFTQTVVESQTCKNHRKCLLQPSNTGADFSASYLECESVTAVKRWVDGGNWVEHGCDDDADVVDDGGEDKLLQFQRYGGIMYLNIRRT